MTGIYASDPDRAPDDRFEPGSLAHLVVGNDARLLDARRTPVRVVGVLEHTGQFVVEILAFEDAGARWAVPVEEVDRYQFATGERADRATIERLAAAAAEFDRPLEMTVDPAAADATAGRLEALEREAREWLEAHSTFLASGRPLAPVGRRGLPALQDDLDAFLEERDLADIERAFSTAYVSNPGAGEVVKGHRIALAEMGLAPYRGKVVRDPAQFEPPFDVGRRRAHIESRLAFVRGVFCASVIQRVTVYRGLSCDGPPQPHPGCGFVSATFDLEVARSHFDESVQDRHGMLVRTVVGVDRLFMTCLETRALNERYLEAEVVLLAEEGVVR